MASENPSEIQTVISGESFSLPCNIFHLYMHEYRSYRLAWVSTKLGIIYSRGRNFIPGFDVFDHYDIYSSFSLESMWSNMSYCDRYTCVSDEMYAQRLIMDPSYYDRHEMAHTFLTVYGKKIHKAAKTSCYTVMNISTTFELNRQQW